MTPTEIRKEKEFKDALRNAPIFPIECFYKMKNILIDEKINIKKKGFEQ